MPDGADEQRERREKDDEVNSVLDYLGTEDLPKK